MEIAELEHYLKSRPNALVIFHFNVFEGAFVAEVQESHLTGFKTIVLARGATVNDCLSTADTTLMAERLRRR